MSLINVNLIEEILDKLAETQEYIAKEEMLKKCDRPQALTKIIRYYYENVVSKEVTNEK
jgi:hypothetical protein